MALAAGALLAPFFLPRKFRVARRVLIRAGCSDIFPLLNDLRNWEQWTEWSRQPHVSVSYEGVSSGVGATRQWRAGRMHGVMRIVQSVPGEQVAYHLDLGYGKHQVDGIISLEPFGEMTRVTWFCAWRAARNPYSRYYDLFMKFRIGGNFDASLQNLRALAEEQTTLLP